MYTTHGEVGTGQGVLAKQHIPQVGYRLITQQAGSRCHDLTHISEVTLWWLQYPQPEMAQIAPKEVMPKLWTASLQVHGNCVTFFYLKNIQSNSDGNLPTPSETCLSLPEPAPRTLHPTPCRSWLLQALWMLFLVIAFTQYKDFIFSSKQGFHKTLTIFFLGINDIFKQKKTVPLPSITFFLQSCITF